MRGHATALLFLLAALWAVPGARADIDNNRATNVQEGDNEHTSDQSGQAGSGDAVVGQVAGVVSSGDASVDATNRTESSEVETGDAEGSNEVASIVGLVNADCGSAIADCPAADVASLSATNVQEGDNAAGFAQAATVASGDGVAGQIVGLVSSGTVDLVLANGSVDNDVETGDATFSNETASVTLLLSSGGPCCSVPSFAADVGSVVNAGIIDVS